jgi:hypothetical protein
MSMLKPIAFAAILLAASQARAQSPSISAGPQVLTLAPGATGGSRITWHQPSRLPPPTRVYQSVDGGPRTLLSTAPNGSLIVTGLTSVHVYTFTVTASNGTAFVEVYGVPSSGGAIWASPSVVTVPPPASTGSSRIDWASNWDPSQVWVSMDGAPETLFATSSSPSIGPQWASWIQPGHIYDFSLYADTTHVQRRGEVRVVGIAPGGGAIYAWPPVVTIAAPASTGTTTLDWSAPGYSSAQVWVSVDGAPETLFAGTVTGPSPASWVQPGHIYDFSLYAGTAHTQKIAHARVAGVSPGGSALVATPAIFHQGATASTTLNFYVAGGGLGDLWVSQNGGPETLFSTDPGGPDVFGPFNVGDGFDFRLYPQGQHTTPVAQAHVFAQPPYQQLGANYFSTDNDWGNSFPAQYHDPAVRTLVLQQIQQMADGGANTLKLVLQVGRMPNDGTRNFMLAYPPNAQDLANVTQYAHDVAGVVARDGHRLRLLVGIGYQYAANFQAGDPTTGLGEAPYTQDAATFLANAQATGHSIVDAVAGIVIPGTSTPVVEFLYFDGEVMIDDPVSGKKNEQWFLENLYGDFESYALSRGVTPSLHFIVDNNSALITGPWTDPQYAVLNDHESCYWAYRGVRWMKLHGFRIPARLDFSNYADPSLQQRVLDDLDATLGTLGGIPRNYGVAETWYDADVNARRARGAAFAAQAYRVSSVLFWPGYDFNTPIAPPFVFTDFAGP